MISGRNDTYSTVAEFAGMIGRSEKTVMNGRTEGRIQFVSLCGVPLIALSMIEDLITGTVPPGADAGGAALWMMNRSLAAVRPETFNAGPPTLGRAIDTYFEIYDHQAPCYRASLEFIFREFVKAAGDKVVEMVTDVDLKCPSGNPA